MGATDAVVDPAATGGPLVKDPSKWNALDLFSFGWMNKCGVPRPARGRGGRRGKSPPTRAARAEPRKSSPAPPRIAPARAPDRPELRPPRPSVSAPRAATPLAPAGSCRPRAAAT
jgi:hypothetical protein